MKNYIHDSPLNWINSVVLNQGYFCPRGTHSSAWRYIVWLSKPDGGEAGKCSQCYCLLVRSKSRWCTSYNTQDSFLPQNSLATKSVVPRLWNSDRICTMDVPKSMGVWQQQISLFNLPRKGKDCSQPSGLLLFLVSIMWHLCN